jgi:tetratricopeptide (TPR) repeat protein
MLDVTQQVADADVDRQAGRLAEASASYLLVVAASPANLRALVGLGLIAKKEGDRERALSFFRQASAHHPREIWPRAELGLLLREMGRRDEAELVLRTCLDDSACPSDLRPTLLVPLGCLVRERRDLASAAELFQEAVSIRPGFRWAQIELGRTLTKLRRFDEAELAFREVLQGEPTDLEALTNLGSVARNRGDRIEALTRFRRAVEAHPHAVEAQAEVAVELSIVGRLREAADAYRTVLKMSPQHPWAWLGLGHVLRRLGDRGQAKIAFSQAAATDPNNIAARLECATEARDTGELDEAVSTIHGILKDSPLCAAAHLSLAQTLLRKGDRKAGLLALQAASGLAPDDTQILVELSDCHRQLGDHAAAIDVLRAALKVNPESAAALNKLGDLFVSEYPEQALEYYRQAAVSNPTSPSPYVGISAALMELGKLEDALWELDNAGQQCGSQPALIIRRSEIMRRLGRTDLASTILRTGSANHPDSVWLRIRCLQMELALGNLAYVAEDIERIKPETVRERGLWHFCCGQLAETEWRLVDALHHYGCAVNLNPDEAWFHHELARINLLCLELDGARKYLAEYSVLTAGRSRRSANISRTHLGQILDEFLLDASAVAAIRDTMHLGKRERIHTLGSIAVAHPDSTAPSIMFLIAVRQAGFLRATQASGSSSIPRILAQYWDTRNIPSDIVELMKSWRAHYADFDYYLFDDDKAGTFIRDNCSPEVHSAYLRSDHPAQKADLFRLSWLYVRGGYYVDADDRCIARSDSYLPPRAELVLYQEEFGTVGNNFIAVIPRHPVLGCALELAATAINRGDRDVLWLSTGPGLLTRALVQTVTTQSKSLGRWLDRIVILERWEMSKFMTPHCASTYKRTDRHWSRKMFGPRPDRPQVQAKNAARQQLSHTRTG